MRCASTSIPISSSRDTLVSRPRDGHDRAALLHGDVRLLPHQRRVRGRAAAPEGPYDIPLAITDRSFNDDGSFFYPEIEGDTLLFGAMGDTILVNGARQPRLNVANRRYRFRF